MNKHARYNRYRREESAEEITLKDEELSWINDEFFYSLCLCPCFQCLTYIAF